jgi:hypothetical protein
MPGKIRAVRCRRQFAKSGTSLAQMKKRPGRCRPGLGSFGRGCLKGPSYLQCCQSCCKCEKLTIDCKNCNYHLILRNMLIKEH